MSFQNERRIDRTARIAVGVVLLILGWGGVVDGALGTVLAWFGFVPLVTGLIGWCPLYALFGVSTCPVEKGAATRTAATAR